MSSIERGWIDVPFIEGAPITPQTMDDIRAAAQRAGGTLDETAPPQIIEDHVYPGNALTMRFTMNRWVQEVRVESDASAGQ
jgi:hypothetical protein